MRGGQGGGRGRGAGKRGRGRGGRGGRGKRRHNNSQQQAAPPPVVKCGVCNEAPPKYKCPTCLIRYCSLPCFKSHKQTPCNPPLPHTATHPHGSSGSNANSAAGGAGGGAAAGGGAGAGAGAAINFDRADRVSQSLFEKLPKSRSVRAMLENKHLRRLLLTIDQSAAEVREQVVRNAMSMPLFAEFADQLLAIASLEDKE